MSNPLVSILVPVYNREKYIEECLESALSQTFSDFEIVVVDNASTDRTWEICGSLARRDSRIRRCRNKTNIGPVLNWGRCFEEARGEFGKILFSDDLIRPEFLEKTVPFLDDEEVGFVLTQAEVGPAPGSGVVEYRWTGRTGILLRTDYLRATLERRSVPVSPGCSLFRLRDLRRNLRTEIKSPGSADVLRHGAGPDLLLWLQTARSYSKVAAVAEPLAFFREHSGTLSRSLEDRLYDYYAQARVSFGIDSGDIDYAAAALAAAWLRHMHLRHGWIGPQEIKRRFLCEPSAVPTGRLLRGAARIIQMRVGGDFLSRFQIADGTFLADGVQSRGLDRCPEDRRG